MALYQDPIDLLLKGTAKEWPISEDVIQRLALIGDSFEGSASNGFLYAAFRDRPVSALIEVVYSTGYLVLTEAQGAALSSAADLMGVGTAYETPFAQDVIERLAPVAESTGFLTKGGFYEAIRDRPVSTMLQWALHLGS